VKQVRKSISARRDPAILRWASDDVGVTEGLDYWADILSSALTPMRVRCPDPRNFEFEMRSAALGQVAVAMQYGMAHDSLRTRHDLARSQERGLYLIMSLDCLWRLDNRGPVNLLPGDLILCDTQYVHEINIRSHFNIINLKLPVEWLRTWSPNIENLAGRRIPANSRWGAALSSFVSQMTPEFAVSSPLPEAVLVDQLGGLLALVADDMCGTPMQPTLAEHALSSRIEECINQRCTEPRLTAAEAAASLNVSARALHRALSAGGTTFARVLMDARTRVAIHMLASPVLDSITTAEIGRGAGFADVAHFSRVLQGRTGRTPLQLRRERDL